MKKYFTLLLTLIVLSISNICSAGIMEDPVAVLPFAKKLTVQTNISMSDSDGALGYIEEELCALSFNMITRTEINRVCEEMRFQQSDLVDPSTAVQLGHLLGAKYLFITNITDLDREGNNYLVHLTSKMIEVETGRVIEGARGEGRANRLDNALTKAAENLMEGKKGIQARLGFKTK